MAANNKRFYIEDARLIFRNFAGRGGKYNREGDRNFCVVIDDPEIAKSMKDDGWNVKYLEPREEGDAGTYYIKVKVSYMKKAPSIQTDNGRKLTSFTEDTVALLDDIDIISADIAINPSAWEMADGSHGISAYLNEMIANVEESRFSKKHQYEEAATADELPF